MWVWEYRKMNKEDIEMSDIYFLTGENCFKCKKALDKLQKLGYDWNVLPTESDEGIKMAIDHQVSNLPAIIMSNETLQGDDAMDFVNGLN